MKMRFALLFTAMFLAACVSADDGEPEGSDEAEDYVVDQDDGKADGVAAVFNQNNVVPEAYFVDNREMTAAEVQAFLEHSPYGTRSWLSDYRTPSGRSAAVAITEEARDENIHPIMLLIRMQGESSIVSKTVRPSTQMINQALGCGCPDGAACNAAYRGFDAQLECGAKTLRRWYDASADRTGEWRVGRTTRTLDNRGVTPANHATASIYQYTPWVLLNRGGAWLTWNVARKYVRHALDEGYLPRGI